MLAQVKLGEEGEGRSGAGIGMLGFASVAGRSICWPFATMAAKPPTTWRTLGIPMGCQGCCIGIGALVAR